MGAIGRLVRRLLAIALVPTVLDGCLVVSDPEFRGQDECVPYFLTHEAEPSNSFPLQRPASATDKPEFSATVPMRSCALSAVYEARIFVDNELVGFGQINPTGTEFRELSFLVDIADYVSTTGSSRCHNIEVFVSQRFVNFATPARSGDIAKISWQFYSDPTTQLSTCGTQ